MDTIGLVTEEITKELFKYKLFKDNEIFFRDEGFKKFVSAILNSKIGVDLKNTFDEMTKEILKKTNIRFNYDFPMIWDNWGLDEKRYLGSGGGVGSEFGFGSDTSFDTSTPVDLKFLLEQVLSFIFFLKKQGGIEVGTIWEEPVKEGKITELNSNVLGKIWLENMSPEDLEKLQIRCKSQLPFDNREIIFKESILMQKSKVIPLIIYAGELAANYNVDLKKSIYFSKDKKYSDIQIITPSISFKEVQLIPLEGKAFLSARLSLKNLIRSFEKLLSLGEKLTGAKQELGSSIGKEVVEGHIFKSIIDKNILTLLDLDSR